MISVIVPVYKVESYLDSCVTSILNQTYTDIEVILVDDGSPDNSGIICDKYAIKDKRVKVIHKKNGGLSSARNAGLDIAKGDFVAFVDSDDQIHRDMLFLLFSMIQEYNADIAICGYQIVKEGLTPYESFSIKDSVLLDKNELWQEVFGKLNNASWNKLYRRDLLHNVRFEVGLIHGEDLLFNLSYLLHCQFGVLNSSPMYYYLKREGSITKSKLDKSRILEITIKDKAYTFIKQHVPAQLINARLFCFRARMNVLRSIFKSKKQTDFRQEISDYEYYVCRNYSDVKSCLKFKEKIEFFLFMRIRPFYKFIIELI